AGRQVGPHQRPRHQGPAQLLEDEHGLGVPEPDAALPLGQAEGEDAGVGQLLPEAAVDAGRVGQLTNPLHWEAALAQLAHALLPGELVLGRQEVHLAGSLGSPRMRSPMMLRWIWELPAAMVKA